MSSGVARGCIVIRTLPFCSNYLTGISEGAAQSTTGKVVSGNQRLAEQWRPYWLKRKCGSEA